jgi:hypothetical protein
VNHVSIPGPGPAAQVTRAGRVGPGRGDRRSARRPRPFVCAETRTERRARRLRTFLDNDRVADPDRAAHEHVGATIEDLDFRDEGLTRGLVGRFRDPGVEDRVNAEAHR